MIDYDKTLSELGYAANSRTKERVKIYVECDKCRLSLLRTKSAHDLQISRYGQYLCPECSKPRSRENRSNAVKKMWNDPSYRSKQESRTHSEELKQQAKERAIKQWEDPQFKDKWLQNFDPEEARKNLMIAAEASRFVSSARLKELWKDPEYRSKMSNQSSDLWDSQEYRDKVINGLKSVYSDPARLEQCRSMAAARWTNQDYRDNWLNSFLQSFTDERRAEISAKSVENWTSSEYRNKIESKWDDNKKKWMSECSSAWWDDEKKSEVSELMIERWSDIEFRNKFIKAFKDSWTEERKVAASAIWTEEKRLEASDRTRKLWENPDFVQKMLAVAAVPSSLEVAFAKILDDYNITYNQQEHIGPYLFDFKIGDSLVEIQGDYWHNLPKTVIKDKAKATYIEKYFPQYKILYVWEHEFYQIDKINKFVETMFGNKLQIDLDFKKLKFVTDVTYDSVSELFDKYHYKESAGRSGLVSGVIYNDILIAACIFTNPTRNVEGGELTRFVIHPHYQAKNLASWFLSRATKEALKKFGKLFTFADPNFNNHGTMYLASNWKEAGTTRPDYWYVSQDGWVMHKKTLYNRAVNHRLKESQYAEAFGYKKVWGLPKIKFIYE